MKRTRQHSHARERARRHKIWLTAVSVVLVIVAAGLAISALKSSRTGVRANAEPVTAAPPSLVATPSPAPSAVEASATVAVEVPIVTGRTLAEARVLLDAMEVSLAVSEDTALVPDAVGDARVVARQEPAPGSLLQPGGVVTIVVPAADARTVPKGRIVVIDPGHQSRGDSVAEAIGPGAIERKPRVTGGTTGVETRMAEYEVVLQIAMNLKARLETAGIEVVMTRTTNDVNISNSERAARANDIGADLFIRIHADGSVDSSQAGISTLYPAKNEWTAPIAERSRVAATSIHSAVIASTGAASRGMIARGDLAGFNWSRVPSVLVECGFLTNPVEDRLLSSPHYQDSLAEGMATGITAYLAQ
ncbi:MAG: N-acetylmuramoyl-L-alanine amidase [Coriobacteriia bacterium]|jgi:N-acetylmuramoyl-L-alanine amidase|nr:N-acetylmuramoyl-L-alanine amidase [Coriobacteriia bacterium]